MTDYTKLSDEALCAEVAEGLLGLTRVKESPAEWVNPLEPQMFNYDCASLQSWSGIGLVVDAMREKGLFVNRFDLRGLSNPPNGFKEWMCRFDNNDYINDRLPWRAVMLAALAALEGR